MSSLRPFLPRAAATLLACGLGAGLALSSCSLVAKTELGAGLGQPCEEDDDCQASECIENICTMSCTSNDTCPAGSTCLSSGVCGVATTPIGALCASSDACESGLCGEDGLCTKACTSNNECPEPSECLGNFCQIPLDVGFIWVGVVEDQGWTKTHEVGRAYAMERLPYLRSDILTDVFLPDAVQSAVTTFVDDGKDVIVANSFSQRNPISESSEDYPEQEFLVCSGNVTKANLGSYFARSYQAWYLAGYAAGAKTQTNRLGYVGSFITPEVVRHIDAFTLGAQQANPQVKVEVRWEGFWFDLDPPDENGKQRETVLAEELMASGCDVIAHGSDNARVVEAVEKAHDEDGANVFSIGNDNVNACDFGPDTCLGVPYWNWGPMYVRIFEEIHKGTWDPSKTINDNIRVNPEDSVTFFGTTDELLSNDLKINLGELRSDLADDPSLVFRGPYNTTGQRTNVAAGEEISDEELSTMCWFVDGVVERVDPNDPLSADKKALVPVGNVEIPPGSGNKPDCRQNQ